MVSRRGGAGSATKIPGLDGIRGVAALAVVFTHLGLFSVHHQARWPVLKMAHGVVGVVAFYVLSGYLITSLMLRELDRSGTVSLRNFYARRALRIFPLYYLFLATFATLQWFGAAQAKGWGHAVGYAYNFVRVTDYSSGLAHAWSLAVEEHFYLLWPAVFLLLRRHQRMLLWLALTTAASGFVAAWTVCADLRNQVLYLPDRWSWPSGCSIMLGCALAIALHDPGLSDSVQRSLRAPWSTALGLALWSAAMLPDYPSACFRLQLSGVGLALLIGRVATSPTGWAVRALDVKPLRALGTVSYGVYIWQGFWLTTGPVRVPGQPWPLPPWLGLIGLAVTVPLSYYLFESPILRLKDRFRGSAPSRSDAVSREQDGRLSPVVASRQL